MNFWKYAPDSPAKRLAMAFTAALLVTLASKGMALLPGYALDDYGVSRVDQSLSFYFSQGRYTQAILQWIASGIDLRVPNFYWPSTLAILLGLPILAAFGATRIGDSRTPIIWQILGASVVCAHPYFTEYFTFRQALYNASVYVALMSIHLYFAYRIDANRPLISRNNAKPLLASAIALTLGLGAHQLVLPMSLSFLTMSMIAARRNLRAPFSPSRHEWMLLAPVILGGACYAILHVAIKHSIGDVGDPRGNLVHIEEIPARAANVTQLLKALTYQEEPLLAIATKALLFIPMLLLAAYGAVKTPKITAQWLIVTIGLIAMSLAPVALSGQWWPVPRALSALGFVLGASLTGLLVIIGNNWLSRAACIAAIASIAFMTMHSASMLQEQQRMNRWDISKAQLIVFDVSRRFGVDAVEKVRLVNGTWSYGTRLRTTTGDMNVSALAVRWAQSALLMEATGATPPSWSLEKVDPTSTECSNRRPWPAEEGIYENADLIYVCL